MSVSKDEEMLHNAVAIYIEKYIPEGQRLVLDRARQIQTLNVDVTSKPL
jgi:hypothetical protein